MWRSWVAVGATAATVWQRSTLRRWDRNKLVYRWPPLWLDLTLLAEIPCDETNEVNYLPYDTQPASTDLISVSLKLKLRLWLRFIWVWLTLTQDHQDHHLLRQKRECTFSVSVLAAIDDGRLVRLCSCRWCRGKMHQAAMLTLATLTLFLSPAAKSDL